MRVRAQAVLIPSLTASVIAAAVALGPASLAVGQPSAAVPQQVAVAGRLRAAPVARPVPVAATAVRTVRAVVRHPATPVPAAPVTSTSPHLVQHVSAAARPAATRAARPAQAAVSKAATRPATQPTVKPAPQPTDAPTTKPTSGPVTTQAGGGDDYPYRSATSNASDPWGFTERQCVSFAAWRLSQHGRALNNGKDSWGSALSWDDTARRLGRTVGTTPTVGSVAQWNAGESSPYYGPGSATANGSFAAGGYGHVAWVKAVYADGSALVEQYNLGSDRSYSVMRVKAPRYLKL